MITIQVHRDHGADEDFEAETLDEALTLARAFANEPGVRRVVFCDDETGNILEEWAGT